MMFLNLIIKEIFYVLTVASVVFVLIEVFWSNIVLAYIDINWVLISWFISAILILVFNKEKGDNDNL